LSKKISGAVNGIVTTDKRVQPIDKSLLLTVNARSTKTVICYLSATQSIEDLSQFHKASIAVLHPHIIALTRYSHGASTRVTVTFDSPTSRNRIDLFDLQGRSLASTECTAPDKRSQLTATLPVRSVAHACYIVRLSAIDTNGTTKQIIRHLLLSE
jgi:hypothetical protein